MSESMRTARAAVRGLIAAGVRDVVLCPGSRSAPLAYAVAEAEAVGALRLHVRTDERTAGFLTLGLACGDPTRPAVVITTSGTAVANLHPAVLEAHHARVPMVVLSADRPAHLHGTWANQTTGHQGRMFGEAVRYADDPAAAVGLGLGVDGGVPGPVHVNLGLDDPLHLDGLLRTDYPATGEPPVPPALPRVPVAWGPRTVVVAGDRAGPAARDLAEQAGWPLFAEPSSGALPSTHAVPGYRQLDLSDIERVVVLGRPTLTRPITRLLNRPDVEVVHFVRHAADPGPGRPYTQVVGVPVAPVDAPGPDPSWLSRWLAQPHPEVPAVAQAVTATTRSGEALVIASSQAIRDMDLAASGLPPDVLVVANRGVAGIDGTVSTALGVAIASGRPTRLLIGDLAFLHDAGALTIPATEPRPDLQVVVVNDRGGAIFATLEYGRRADFFERVFGTPHDVDVAALARAHGVPATVIDDARLLPPRAVGLSLVEVRVARVSPATP